MLIYHLLALSTEYCKQDHFERGSRRCSLAVVLYRELIYVCVYICIEIGIEIGIEIQLY